MKDEKGRCYKANSGCGMVPMQVFAEIEEREDGENHQRDDLLNHLELHRAEALRADAIGGHLQAVFKESDSTTDQDDLPQRILPVLQVTIPGKGHEDIREDEK